MFQQEINANENLLKVETGLKDETLPDFSNDALLIWRECDSDRIMRYPLMLQREFTKQLMDWRKRRTWERQS